MIHPTGRCVTHGGLAVFALEPHVTLDAMTPVVAALELACVGDLAVAALEATVAAVEHTLGEVRSLELAGMSDVTRATTGGGTLER